MKKWFLILCFYGALSIGVVANTASYFQGSNNFLSENSVNLVKQEETEDKAGLLEIIGTLKGTTENFESDVQKSRYTLLQNYNTSCINSANRKLKIAQEKYEKLKKSKSSDSKEKGSKIKTSNENAELNTVESNPEGTQASVTPSAGDWVYINVDRANVYLSVKKDKVFVVATKGMKFKVKGIVKDKPLAQIEFTELDTPLYVSLSDIAIGEGTPPAEPTKGYFFNVVHKGKVTIPDWGTYWCSINIPSIGLTENAVYGDYQWQVDDYEICSSMLFGLPGTGLSSLFLGHNYKALKSLPKIKVGDTIDVATSYGVYKYKVTYSGYCITDGYKICDTTTGKNMLENRSEPNGAEIVQFYTCMNSNISPTPYRWFVKAELVSK